MSIPPLTATLNYLLPAFLALAVSGSSAEVSGMAGSWKLQDSTQEPELYRQARDALARADTLAALAHLRELTETNSDYAAGWGLLGQVLTEKASGVSTDFRERREADRALRRALELDGNHPLYLMALGKLMRKQNLYLDSRRVLGRAMGAIEEDPGRLPPAERSELWYQRGLFYEDEYLDVRNQVFIPDLPVSTADCAGLGTFCMNFTRPARFNEYFKNAAPLDEFGRDDFERMANAFRRALDADPTNPGAFRRLAIHLVDRGDYREAERLSRRYVSQVPESPWGHLMLGLIYHRTGRDSLAEASFEEGLKYAPEVVAAHYRDISSLLRRDQEERYTGANEAVRRRIEDVLWRKSDPLYLTPGNEVRVAHFARVTYADIMFEDPSSGAWGADTERGDVYVRYGPPKRIWQVPRETRRELSAEGFSTRSTSVEVGGRWIFWNYDWNLPNFVFERSLRQRATSHVLSSSSKLLEEDAKEVQPAVYSTSFEMLDHPVQIARFRGTADTLVEFDLYAEVPADQLLQDRDSLDLGLFLFTGADHQKVYERELDVEVPASPQALTFSIPLPEGIYTYSLEARGPVDRAAVRRGELLAEGFPADRLALSDLVIADAVTPKVPEPRNRRDFALTVNRRLEFEPGDPIALYWEVYGLSQDDDGLAHFDVTIEVEDTEGGGVLATVVGAIGRTLGLSGEEGLRLSYERVVDLTEDRVPEFIELGLDTQEPGTYAVQIQVTDQLTGNTTEIARRFRIRGQ